ncbi:MAG: AMP-binding protein [Chloroflexi bacterium]|nr:AMP-binding protein [Chloroflexota bacterium]
MMDWLTERSAASADALALISGKRRWTYGELDRLVNALAGSLQAQGVQPGDLVAALLPNSLTYVCLIHALARLGAVLVPLNTRLTEDEIAWQIGHVGAKWLVAERELSIVNCQLLIVNEEFIRTAESLTIDHCPLTIDNLQCVVFTSGTSGRPKGAMLTFANHYASAMASAERLGVRADDRWLSVLPLYHVGGLAVILRSCLAGTAVSLHPRFDLDAINDDLDHNPISLISLVPTMLHRLLETRTHWPASLRLILLGGAAAPAELVEQANALPRKAVGSRELVVDSNNFTIHNSPPLVAPTYGLTEAASQVATATPEEAARKPGSVGKPLPGLTVTIVDEHGRSLPPNTPGEIVVSGPTVMAGYFIADCGLRRRQSAIRNLPTGDIGYLDEEGDLWVMQRRSDLIVSGGENVYPAEVEVVLKSHPAVADACVVGAPDVVWGQVVAAAVVLREETAVTPTDLAYFCRERLAGYKTPRRWQICPALPHTPSGKIARREVAAMFA